MRTLTGCFRRAGGQLLAASLLAVLASGCSGGPGGGGCGEEPSEAAARCHGGALAEGELLAAVSSNVATLYLFDAPNVPAPPEAAYVLFDSRGPIEASDYHAFGGQPATGQRVAQWSASGDEPGQQITVRGHLFGVVADERITRVEVAWNDSDVFSADVAAGYYLVPIEAPVPLGVRLTWTFLDHDGAVVHSFVDP